MSGLESSQIIVRLIVCYATLHLATAILPDAACLSDEKVDSPESSQLDMAPAKGFEYLGKIRPRHARDIKSSNWSVGAETMDRDYTIYAN